MTNLLVYYAPWLALFLYSFVLALVIWLGVKKLIMAHRQRSTTDKAHMKHVDKLSEEAYEN